MRRTQRPSLPPALALAALAALCACALSFWGGTRYARLLAGGGGEAAGAAGDLARGLPLDAPCAWPADVRPLAGQEWLDVPQLAVQLPFTPAPASVRATRRPGAAYAHMEFWRMAEAGIWEPATFRVLRTVLRARRGALLDIGGWIGATALAGAAWATRVVALEPDPRAFSELLENVRLNARAAHLAPVTPLRLCLGAESGEVDMAGPAPLGSSMSRVRGAARLPASAADERNWGTAPIVSWRATCLSPAALAARTGLAVADVALVKVDTEGAEAALLPALLRWAAHAPRRPAILVEIHEPFWQGDGAAARRAVASALGEYAHVYRTARASTGPAALERFDVRAAAAAGAICFEEFCTVLATDEPVDWEADAAAVAAVPFAEMAAAFWTAAAKEEEDAAAAAAAAV